jgi:hypothetical protein
VQPRPPWAPPVPPQQVRRHPALVEKDIPTRIPDREALAPAPAIGRDVRTPLFVGVYRFF